MGVLQSNHARGTLACLVVALAGAVPVQASWTGHPPGKNCVWADDSGREEEGVPRNLRPAFYKRAVTLVVSADGLHGQEIPISIEAVCDVPEKLAKGAARLAGADGVALRLHRTTVWENRALKIGPPATVLIEGVDTALLKGRLTRPGAWRQDRNGSRIPTFRAGRIVVVD
jgi:hypothetical protein